MRALGELSLRRSDVRRREGSHVVARGRLPQARRSQPTDRDRHRWMGARRDDVRVAPERASKDLAIRLDRIADERARTRDRGGEPFGADGDRLAAADELVTRPLVERRVDLSLSRIERRTHPTGRHGRRHRERVERRDPDEPMAPGERQSLCETQCDAKSGERSRPDRDGERIVAPEPSRLIEDLRCETRQRARVVRRRPLRTLGEDATVLDERDAALPGRGVDRENARQADLIPP